MSRSPHLTKARFDWVCAECAKAINKGDRYFQHLRDTYGIRGRRRRVVLYRVHLACLAAKHACCPTAKEEIASLTKKEKTHAEA